MPTQYDNSTDWPRPLAKSFYDRQADIVARGLIGKTLLRRTDGVITGGVIVETEAYLSDRDPSCHAHRGLTARNRTMFGPSGRLYVYTIHAKYCLNAVTEREGKGSAVLIRAIEPLWGIELMQGRRGFDELTRLCRGPAMLCQAMAIDLRHDGVSITEANQVWIGHAKSRVRVNQIGVSTRIGISKATQMQLRFFVRGSSFVSGPKKLNSA